MDIIAGSFSKKKSAGKKYNKKNRRQNPDLVLHIYASLLLGFFMFLLQPRI